MSGKIHKHNSDNERQRLHTRGSKLTQPSSKQSKKLKHQLT